MKTFWFCVLLAVPAASWAGVLIPLGNGWYGGTDDRGNTITSVPLGNGWRVTTSSDGRSVTSYPLGGGWIGTQERGPREPMEWPTMQPME